jgi:hypothetical protein
VIDCASMDVGRNLDPPVRWVRASWDQPDLIGPLADGLDGSRMEFLYELTATGEVLRSIELMGAARVPVGAASVAEFWEAQEYRHQPATPTLIRSEEQFGSVPEGSESDWGDYPHDEITAEEFERCWEESRGHLSGTPRSDHFA